MEYQVHIDKEQQQIIAKLDVAAKSDARAELA